MTTPGVTWNEEQDKPLLTAPVIEHLPTRRGQGLYKETAPSWEFGVPWGGVGAWRPAKRSFHSAWINCVALEFTLPEGSFSYLDAIRGLGPPDGGTVEDLFRTVDSYFLNLLTWVGVACDHDTDHEQALSRSEIPGNGLVIRSIEPDGRVSSSTGSTRMSMVSIDTRNDVLNLGTVRKLITLANQDVMPHDSHLLMREAHAARRRGRRRRAVIDAGTATELGLAEWNVASNGDAIPKGGRPRTLGWYVGQAKGVVPANTHTGLVEVRNNAVHHNLVPTHPQVIEALSIADTIVNSIEPLPRELHRTPLNARTPTKPRFWA